MELSKNEIAMIKVFREVGECPGNIILWYSAGLKGSADKIRHVAPDYAERDEKMVKEVNTLYNKLKEY